jgi:hypothetical protein
MTISVTSPITGSAQTGLTAPTYSLTADTPPSPNAKQNAVTALGGTQTGVTTHSVASPFTITAVRPLVFKLLALVNPVTNVLKNVPKNAFKIITRKGVIPLAGQAPQVMLISTTIDLPAGADLADPANVRAALSAHIGALSQQSAGIGDTAVTGIL